MQTSSYAARALVAALSSLPFALLTSCQSPDEPFYSVPETQGVPVTESAELEVDLSTDLAVPQDIDSIRIERSMPDISTRPISTEDHELAPTDLELPTVLRFQIYSQEPESDSSVGLRVIAWKG